MLISRFLEDGQQVLVLAAENEKEAEAFHYALDFGDKGTVEIHDSVSSNLPTLFIRKEHVPCLKLHQP